MRHRNDWLRLRRFISPIIKFFSPGYTWCDRCKLSWTVVSPHVTYYNSIYGCFALCETCWSELEPTDRLPFYEIVIDAWRNSGSSSEEDFKNIRLAVLNNK